MSVLYATRTVSDAFWVRAMSIAWLSATCACSERSTPTRIFVNIECLLGFLCEREDHPDCGACRVYRRRASADVRWLRARPLVARLREPSALSSVRAAVPEFWFRPGSRLVETEGRGASAMLILGD